MYSKNLKNSKLKSYKHKHLLFSSLITVGMAFPTNIITQPLTKSKINENNWEILKPLILTAIMEHYASGKEVIEKNQNNTDETTDEDTEVVKQIKELIDQRVRPAVAMDGGDISFCSFEDGVVTLQMKGACAGCPSSTATLKMGIENMLRHYIPEVVEVKAAEL